jgi:hypothetical protein
MAKVFHFSFRCQARPINVMKRMTKQFREMVFEAFPLLQRFELLQWQVLAPKLLTQPATSVAAEHSK